ncbi:MAG: WD40 repeat domain-containing protein [Bacteroidales bacterium]|nr:WD40 repeat domain-containing protein [Bacteroidales bacterium]
MFIFIFDFMFSFQLLWHVNMHGNGNSTSSSGGNTSNPETDTTDFLYLQTLQGHSSYVLSVSWSPDGRFFASGSNDATIKMWGVE